ncbi:MAG: universal stress protein [Polaribacter sp.]|nr:universal stress protein [Polaribacter sp.]
MNKILVPIDFSKSSEFACKMASKIAKKSNSSIYLLHMIELPSGIVDMGAGSNFSIPESMLYLRKIKDRILEYKEMYFSKNKEVHHAIKFQHPFDGILKYTEKINPDLIVMGYKGHSEFEEILIGSNTEKVVRTASIPVLVVKRDEEKINIKDIVFASSFNKADEIVVLEKVQKFANAFKSKIHLLTVNTQPNLKALLMLNKKIINYIEDLNLSKYTINIYSDATVERGILHFAKEIDADLIALATHGRSGIAHLFTNSVTKTLSKNALRPVLTIKL